jgi:excisionase family DNA binding protein
VEEKSEAMSQQLDASQSRFMTAGEVASVLRVSTMTVYRLINAGELPAVRIGRSFRLRSEDLDRYLAARFTKAG